MIFLKGWRTHIFMVLVLVSGVLDQFGALDMKGFFAGIGVPDAKIGFAMVVFSMCGIVLRQVTSTPPGKAS